MSYAASDFLVRLCLCPGFVHYHARVTDILAVPGHHCHTVGGLAARDRAQMELHLVCEYSPGDCKNCNIKNCTKKCLQ